MGEQSILLCGREREETVRVDIELVYVCLGYWLHCVEDLGLLAWCVVPPDVILRLLH